MENSNPKVNFEFWTVLSSVIKSKKKNLGLTDRNCYSRGDLIAHSGKIISKSNFELSLQS